MANSFGTLGDFFPDTDIRCRIRNCNNVWHFSGEAALQNVAAGESARPERMCDECFAEYRQLSAKQVACATPACDGTWVWTPMQQLNAKSQGHNSPPKGFCPNCQKQLNEVEDREVNCRIKCCSSTWTWTARQQLLSKHKRPPSRFCDDCYHIMRSLRLREIPCRMAHCDHTWTWNEFSQLEHVKSGGKLDEPPGRMCESCYQLFMTLQDIERPCKVEECNRTWVLRRFDHLQHKLKSGMDAPLPDNMCKSCYNFSSRAKSRSIRCRNRGCPNTWTYSREEQLADWIRGKKRPEPRLCEACADKIAVLAPSEVPCSVPGCSGTWTYLPEEQVKDQCFKRSEPPTRRCNGCEQFLSSHATQTIACKHCGQDINWSSYEQLLCHHGTFVVPARCVDCAEQELALKPHRKDEPERTHRHVVKMPASGIWQRQERIHNWPKHLNYEVIGRIEEADCRIVAIGDDLTFADEDGAKAWPYLLEQRLNEHFAGKHTVAVVNAGIPRSTTEQALLRYPRDIVPFAPQLVIFSFAFADAYLHFLRDQQQWKVNANTEQVPEHVEAWCRRLQRKQQSALCWIPNPIFPEERQEPDWDADFSDWARAQTEAYEQALRLWRRTCTKYNLPVADLYPRFEVNGSKSAKKWLCDWCRPNDAGAQNIARWLAEYIVCNNLIQLPTASA